jgi:hypothetical protein
MTASRAADLVAIDELLRRYADIATRQAWHELSEIVLPGAPVTFSFTDSDALEVRGPDGLAQLGRTALRTFTFYLYVPLNNVVQLADDTATATGRAYALETATDRDGNWLDIYGHYDDEYARTGSTWMIAGRRYREMVRHVR